MQRTVIIAGNLTIDDVVHPDGRTEMGTIGGNSVHASAAALVWARDVRVVTRRGDDFPRWALDELAEAGADVSAIRPVPGPTVRSWVIYEEGGRRTWVYRTPPGRPAEVALRPADIPASWLSTTKTVLHIAAMPLVAAKALAERARQQQQAIITLDSHEDWHDLSQVMGVARLADVFLPSREELAALLGYDDPPRAVAALIAAGLRCVVAKLGADGALVAAQGKEPVRIPAYPVTATDTTGAGDSFCGAFAAGLALGDDPVTAARRGCATAAAAIGATGSLRLLRRAGQARDLLNGQPATDRYDIGVMRDEIATIPAVITGHAGHAGHVAELGEWLSARGIRNICITGCGDSLFAGQAVALAFARHSGMRAEAVHALELARYRVRYLPPDTAVLAVSFSGKVGRTVEAAVQAAKFGHPVIALTGNDTSPLAEVADRVLPVDVPTLGFSPGTSTYIGMVCTLLSLAMGSSALAELPGLAERTLRDCEGPAAEVASRLATSRFVTFLGAGPNEATAQFGAAKVFEGAQRLAIAANLEEWAHEQYFITRPGDPVVVIAPSGAGYDRAREIMAELAFIKADAVLVSDAGDADLPLAGGAPEELTPVLAALPLSQAGFHLARHTGKRSYNFASEQARDEHYATIHRATIGEPALWPTGRFTSPPTSTAPRSACASFSTPPGSTAATPSSWAATSPAR